MSTLEDIIDAPEHLEFKRAVAVKMFSSNFKTEDIYHLLNVSDSFVSKWQIIYENEGADGRGTIREVKDFGQKTSTMPGSSILKNQPYSSVEELRDYIERHYGVVYESKQSYYDLLREGGLSWHQTQAVNPKTDLAQVEQRREEIKKSSMDFKVNLLMEKGFFSEDEAYALWGNTLGHMWCRENQRTEVPIENAKERQTYYGVTNLYNQEFKMSPYDRGNGENTIGFLKYLQAEKKEEG